jgi:hypothetical protein
LLRYICIVQTLELGNLPSKAVGVLFTNLRLPGNLDRKKELLSEFHLREERKLFTLETNFRGIYQSLISFLLSKLLNE